MCRLKQSPVAAMLCPSRLIMKSPARGHLEFGYFARNSSARVRLARRSRRFNHSSLQHLTIEPWTKTPKKWPVGVEDVALRNLARVAVSMRHPVIKTAALSWFGFVLLGLRDGHTIFAQDVTGRGVTSPGSCLNTKIL
ncbi:uncharacterized protein ARMOST_18469 [Armillaria ostoyae]|uniref:Uncharacterized protein n=1 Tax=Armillaria ostoyae TaxID=47428 RepID=A0A284S1U9_ARMOS|nr:uncharacterized protein ARMOST_18469 [Armillaria ostoyae]